MPRRVDDAAGHVASSSGRLALRPAPVLRAGAAAVSELSSMALREFTDERGVRWTVWSVSSDALHPATRSEDFLRQFASGWLCFESGTGEKRRLLDYPEGWEALGDDALAVLCGRAVPRPAGRPARGPAAERAGRVVPALEGDPDVVLASAELSERRRTDLAPPPEHPRRRREDRAG